MSNQNGGVAATPFEEPEVSRAQELFGSYEHLLRLSDYYERLSFSGASSFSSMSDLQTLESEFTRLDVSDSSARQQLLQDNRGRNQFPLDGRSHQGMNGRGNLFPSNSYNDYVNGYDAHERSQYYFFNGNLRDVPFSPRNPFFDLTPWGYAWDYYIPGFCTNHDTIISCPKDRIESDQLQDVIAKGTREMVDKIFENLISHVFDLMIDPFGHKVFQKLLEKCTYEQVNRILDIVIQQPHQFVRVCVDSHGTSAIQDLMGRLCSEEQLSPFMATLCHVALLLTKDINASHVIVFCFKYFPLSQSRKLLEVIVQNCYQVAIDQHGCVMLPQCIRKSSPQIRGPLIKEIIKNALRLCVNGYGNYVVQFVLELEDSQLAAAISRHLNGNYVYLSCDKYGSHAVQKCLKNRAFSSRRIITELLLDIDLLLVNPFGNYVIQTAWIVCEDDVRYELLYHINRNAPLLRCDRYGRKVLEKLNLWRKEDMLWK